MTIIDSIEQQLNLFGGQLAFLLFLVASIQLFRVHRTGTTLAFLAGMLTAWVGLLGQWFAPMPDPTYIMEGGEIVGATGAFPESWIIASSIFYVGLLVASTGLVWHVFSMTRKGTTDT